MPNVKKIIINENLKHNASSNIKFECKAGKSNFIYYIETQSMRPLFFDKVDFENFEINLQVTCLNEGLIQRVDKDGCVLVNGEFFHKNDSSYTVLNLTTEINHSSWLKLKSDLLLLKTERLQLNVFNIIFDKIIKDCENESIECSINASFGNYQIIKVLN